MKTLLAGPWVGEFGWELFCWQGHVRRIAKDYDKVAVACRPGHEVLYKDFADKIISYTPSSNTTNMFMCEGDSGNALAEQYDCTHYLGGHFNIGFPVDRPKQASNNFKNQQFVPYGVDCFGTGEAPVVIHARATHKHGSENRNWSPRKWEELISKIRQPVMCIGTKDAALHFDGTSDARGVDLGRLTNILAGARMIIGPSSGPIHLATLCRCPQVIWSGFEHSAERYKKYWNPFNTKVEYIQANNWDPDIDSVLECMRSF